MKRRIRQNAWGNWKGYLGTRKVEDFGTEQWNAFEWLLFGTVSDKWEVARAASQRYDKTGKFPEVKQ